MCADAEQLRVFQDFIDSAIRFVKAILELDRRLALSSFLSLSLSLSLRLSRSLWWCAPATVASLHTLPLAPCLVIVSVLLAALFLL